MEKLLTFIREKDLFARHCGIELVSAEPGRAVARLRVADEHRNGLGMAHGGAIFALADLAFAAAANSRDAVAVGVNASISFFKAAPGGTLEAVAAENADPRRIGGYTVEVRDEAGDLVALFQGLAYRKRDTPPFLSRSPE